MLTSGIDALVFAAQGGEAAQGAQAAAQAQAAQAQAREQMREAIRAQVDAQREAIRAQIEAARAAREAGRATVIQPIPPFPPLPIDSGLPGGVVLISIAFFVACAFTIVGLPLARAFARRMDRRGAMPPERPETTARLERIEQAVEAIAIEVERISEGQRFTNQVMGELRALPEGTAPAEPLRVRAREELSR